VRLGSLNSSQTSREGLIEILLLLRTVGTKIQTSKAMLMSEGTSAKALRGRDLMLVEFCKNQGYCYCSKPQVREQ